jgi:heptosyltransferase-1
MTEVIARPEDKRRIGSEYLHLAQELGLPANGFPMDVTVKKEDEAFATGAIEREGLESGYAVLCPFTTRPQKHWVARRWVELASDLRRIHGLAPVLLGGPGDLSAAGEMVGGEPGILNLVGKTRIGQAAAVIRRARLLVGVDTGLTHIGLALGVPSVVLFGSTCPYLDPGEAKAVILYKDLTCAPCQRKPTCDGEFTCMRDISTAEVIAAAAGVLE